MRDSSDGGVGDGAGDDGRGGGPLVRSKAGAPDAGCRLTRVLAVTHDILTIQWSTVRTVRALRMALRRQVEVCGRGARRAHVLPDRVLRNDDVRIGVGTGVRNAIPTRFRL